MIHPKTLVEVRDILTDSSISHVAIRCDRALQAIDKAISYRDETLPGEIAFLLNKAIAGTFSPSDVALAKVIVEQLQEYQ